MKLSFEPYTLELHHTWRIAHGASDQRHNVLVQIGDGEVVGLGEAAGVPHHGESQGGIITYLEHVMDRDWDPFQMEDMLAAIPDEKERYRLIKKINFKIMKLNVMGRKSPLLEEKQIYYKKLIDKMADK